MEALSLFEAMLHNRVPIGGVEVQVLTILQGCESFLEIGHLSLIVDDNGGGLMSCLRSGRRWRCKGIDLRDCRSILINS